MPRRPVNQRPMKARTPRTGVGLAVESMVPREGARTSVNAVVRSLGSVGVLLAVTGGGGAVAHAQTAEQGSAVDSLDLVKVLNVEVSTASKRAESLDDAPAVITVVTRSEIERWG